MPKRKKKMLNAVQPMRQTHHTTEGFSPAGLQGPLSGFRVIFNLRFSPSLQIAFIGATIAGDFGFVNRIKLLQPSKTERPRASPGRALPRRRRGRRDPAGAQRPLNPVNALIPMIDKRPDLFDSDPRKTAGGSGGLGAIPRESACCRRVSSATHLGYGSNREGVCDGCQCLSRVSVCGSPGRD